LIRQLGIIGIPTNFRTATMMDTDLIKGDVTTTDVVYHGEGGMAALDIVGDLTPPIEVIKGGEEEGGTGLDVGDVNAKGGITEEILQTANLRMTV